MATVTGQNAAFFACASPPLNERKRVAAEILQLTSEGQPKPYVRLFQLHMDPPAAWCRLETQIRERGECATLQRAALRASLSPRHYRVPFTPVAAASRCCLAGTAWAKRFASKALNKWLADVLCAIPQAVAGMELPAVELSQWDLHHAHLFVSYQDSGCLGLLAHAREYPANFPVSLGFCQEGSRLQYSADEMAWRNILYYKGSLAAIDVGPSSPLHSSILMDGLQVSATVLEEDFGTPLASIYYMAHAKDRRRKHRIYIVPLGG